MCQDIFALYIWFLEKVLLFTIIWPYRQPKFWKFDKGTFGKKNFLILTGGSVKKMGAKIFKKGYAKKYWGQDRNFFWLSLT